jgi:hypothetical protein
VRDDDMLKRFHGAPIQVPTRRTWRPDPERLAVRYGRFLEASGAPST